MAWRLPLCLFNRHTPLRKRVKWDGLNFVGTCRFCKHPIRKQHHGGWQKDWIEGDSHLKGPLPPAPAAFDE